MFISSKKFPYVVHALALSIATILISGCSAPLPKCSGDSPALQATKEKAKDDRVTDNKVARNVLVMAVCQASRLDSNVRGRLYNPPRAERPLCFGSA